MSTATITVKVPKPRAKRVNEILRTKKGGPMRSPFDFNRAAEKQKLRQALTE